ncbi:trans-aconitate 2-methyltransferase [Streptomyces sp. NPDC001380]|uniref:trans-aconitate 2-methyltransferase n=1 Tax=Streptomyces sp. NPDC001380 TaxID=3364566 RepID=UPI00368D021D
MTRWDPDQYLRYDNHRTRPLHDLLHRIPADTRPHRILDLGCGPGNSTAPLRTRWPDARITGVDTSPEMLAAARTRPTGPDPGGTGTTDYVLADAATWDPAPHHPDLIVTNALLQWIPDHLPLLDRWTRALTPGGTLALQLPGNFDAPSHTLLAALRTSPRWKDRLADGARRDAAAHDPAAYLDRLTAAHCTADVWETTYHQLLPGPDPVLEWAKGTALRPVLTRLDPPDRAAFLDEYAALLRQAYPPGPHGTAFPFRRIFAVARRNP